MSSEDVSISVKYWWKGGEGEGGRGNGFEEDFLQVGEGSKL